jgi:hypothetical protein
MLQPWLFCAYSSKRQENVLPPRLYSIYRCNPCEVLKSNTSFLGGKYGLTFIVSREIILEYCTLSLSVLKRCMSEALICRAVRVFII